MRRPGIKAAQQQFDAAKANHQQAEANNVKAQNDLARYKQLVEKQEISQQQYDQAVAAARAGSAGVEAARASADAANAQVTQAEGKLAQARQTSAPRVPRPGKSRSSVRVRHRPLPQPPARRPTSIRLS